MSATNGIEYPIFQIKSGQALIETIELNLTNQEGLHETYTDFTIRKRLKSGKRKSIPRLNDITFILHYNEWLLIEDALKIEKILDREYEGYDIWLIPRADVKSRKFQVEYTGEAFSMGVLPGGTNAVGNRLPIVSWGTKELTKKKFRDPNTIIYIPAFNAAVEPD